jgi:hypothetical protein|tara:strand:- start:5460 stop:5588 length:129 start_codon:yes stop_codon:yes gene_type:complete
MVIMGVGYQPTTIDISPTSPKRLRLERLSGSLMKNNMGEGSL